MKRLAKNLLIFSLSLGSSTFGFSSLEACPRGGHRYSPSYSYRPVQPQQCQQYPQQYPQQQYPQQQYPQQQFPQQQVQGGQFPQQQQGGQFAGQPGGQVQGQPNGQVQGQPNGQISQQQPNGQFPQQQQGNAQFASNGANAGGQQRVIAGQGQTAQRRVAAGQTAQQGRAATTIEAAPAQAPAAAPAQAAPINNAPATAAPSGAEESALEALAAFGVLEEPAPINTSAPAASPLAGRWVAKLSDTVTVELSLNADGTFQWNATAAGKSSAFSGTYSVVGGTLTLVRSTDNQKLIGDMTTGANGFNYKLTGAKDAGLNFSRG